MAERAVPETYFRPVNVKLIGVLASAFRHREVQLDTTEGTTVSDILSALIERAASRQFSELLIDSGTGDPRANVIILVNDQDCNLFKGLRTSVPERALVTVIPIAHGG